MSKKKINNIEKPTTVKKIDIQYWQHRWAYVSIIVLCFLIYGNTLPNKYALDDAIVITQNIYTQQGISGIDDIFSTELFTGFFKTKKNLVAGGRYRPLSVATFAIEYEFFGFNPHISHVINILFYALTCILLYNLLLRLFINYKIKQWFLSIPFVACIIYLVHPLHTEVVANIKGRDEIFALLGAIITIQNVLNFLDTQKRKYLFYAFIAFFLALISKEMALTFVIIIPLTVYYFTSYSLKSIIKTSIPIWIAASLFFIIRTIVVGVSSADIPKELMNDSFLGASLADRMATVFYTMGLYIKLLFIPHPLTYDYYPYHIKIMKWSNFYVVSSFILYIVMGAYAIFKMPTKSVYSYGIIYYLVTFSIVSNFFFPIGTFMSERFMYMPSLGFAIIVAYFIVVDVNIKVNFYKIVGLSIIVLLYSFKTIDRNTAWRNDLTLFTTDVKVSFNSAKSTCSAGGKLTEEAQLFANILRKNYTQKDSIAIELLAKSELPKKELQHLLEADDVKTIVTNLEEKRKQMLTQAIDFLTKSVAIYPQYADALLLLGNAYYEYDKNIEKTMDAYKRILVLNPNYERVWGNIDIVMTHTTYTPIKYKIMLDFYKINPNRYEVNYWLGVIYGKEMNRLDSAIYYFERAVSIDPSSVPAMKDLGAAYGMTKQYEKALAILKRALTINPNDEQVLINLGITYMNMNNVEKANEAFLQAQKINPSFVNPLNNMTK